jgi:hypothetical protein
MFALSLVTTLSLIGALWFTSFQHNVYALLNPDASNTVGEQYFADASPAARSESPFAAMGQLVKDMRASIGQLFTSGAVQGGISSSPAPSASTGRAQALPLSQ